MSVSRPGLFIRAANRALAVLIRIGLPVGHTALLTVPGRRTGLPRTTVVALTDHGDGWVVGSPFGAADWVWNLRAAGWADVTRRRRTTSMRASELIPVEAAPLLRRNLAALGPLARRVLGRHFAIPFDSPLEDWVDEAPRHPMFLLEPLAKDGA